MILRSFHIQNFRSIVDTGWCDLSLDNITSLIGQNESGKTSILAALHSFYKGQIVDDDIRSGGEYPIISCSFSTNSQEIKKLFEEKYFFPKGLYEKIDETRRINLKRKWDDKERSSILLEELHINEVFEKHEKLVEEHNNKLVTIINEEIDLIKEKENNLNELLEQKKMTDKELSSLKKRMEELSKQIVALPEEQQNIELKSEFENTKNNKDRLEKELENITNDLTECQKEYDKLKDNSKLIFEYKELLIECEKNENNIKDIEEKILKLQSSLETSPPEQKPDIEKKLKQANKDKDIIQNKINDLKKEVVYKRKIIGKYYEGLKKSIKPAINDYDDDKPYCTKEVFAAEISKAMPIFEMFENFSSLLPDTIDINDIETKSDRVPGVQGVKNFLIIAGLTINDFPINDGDRIFENKIDKINREITKDFQKFWKQEIGKNNKIKIQFEYKFHSVTEADKAGKPYLAFYIMDQHERLYPKQRSEGVRWFLSFYIQIKASRIRSKEKGIVLLVDEPGNNLHAKAQEDVLKVFEESKKEITIIYATHCPHLLNINNIHRVLGVQRSGEFDISPTEVLGLHKIGSAKADTFTALYTLMGARLSDQAIIKEKNNILLEEISAFYYLTAFWLLMNMPKEVSLLPATGANNIPQLANLFIGWGLDFIVFLDDDEKGRDVYNLLKKNLFFNDDSKAEKKLYKNKKCQGIEDIFTKGDFKKHVLENESIQYDGNNSDYLKRNQESKGILALKFKLKVEKKEIKKEDLAVTTQKNIEELTNKINSFLK